MRVSHVQTDGAASSTGKLMHQMVELYCGDMLGYAHMGIVEVFDIVKRVPFKPDPEEFETLQRPMYTMGECGWGGDCDDKSIAFACYCRLAGIPYRFVAVRRADHETLHHVMCYVYIARKWIQADPTYSFNSLGHEREAYQEYVTI
jgi:transglutaminase-like putative cysteine protease